MDDFSTPDAMNEFGYPPSPANFIKPRKRPLSSITPIIAEDQDGRGTGALAAVVGAAGGSRIISSTVLTLWRVLDRHSSLLAALREPRLHDQLKPNLVKFELGFDNATIASMIEKGHKVITYTDRLSSVQFVRRLRDGAFEAMSEPRQQNSAGFTI